MWYRVEYEVEGAGRFPFDMLRYDSSSPVAPDDAYMLDGDDIDRRVVKLKTYTDRKDWTPTTGRWSSFGWSVVRGSIREVAKFK